MTSSVVPFNIGIQTTGINGIHVRDILSKNDGICNTRTPPNGALSWRTVGLSKTLLPFDETLVFKPNK